MSKQIQKSGDYSNNHQSTGAMTINYGADFDEIKAICIGVFIENFELLSKKAYAKACKRMKIFVEKFITELFNKNREGIMQVEDPGFQHSLYSAQKLYACSGDDNLGDLLIQFLVERSKHPNRDAKQIVINEAITTLPKLSDKQIDILSIVFIIDNLKHISIKCPEDLIAKLNKYLSPFSKSISKNHMLYLHLSYASCCDFSGLSRNRLGNILFMQNSFLFNNGFKEDALKKENIEISDVNILLGECYHDKLRLQITCPNYQFTRSISEKEGLNRDMVTRLINLNGRYSMNFDEVENYLKEKLDFFAELTDVWNNSLLRAATLTSVGTEIAIANIRNKIGTIEEFNVNLNYLEQI